MNLNSNANDDVTHDDDFRRIAILKQTTKLLLFSILRRNLWKFVTQTGLYCSNQLETTFSSILWKTVAYHLEDFTYHHEFRAFLFLQNSMYQSWWLSGSNSLHYALEHSTELKLITVLKLQICTLWNSCTDFCLH